MEISAQVRNSSERHEAEVTTAGNTQSLDVPQKAVGAGSAVNGGELLMLALATCYCNDIYREAARLGIVVDAVEVQARADFDGAGLGARNVTYRARIASPASRDQVDELIRQTDAVAEIHNTLRAGAAVTLAPWDE